MANFHYFSLTIHHTKARKISKYFVWMCTSLHWRENETWMKNQYTGDWNSFKFSKTSYISVFKRKTWYKVYQSYYNTLIIRGNHLARLSRESAMHREWWLWWKTSHCNTLQKQTHYEYYYFNKLIQLYKARKINIAFTRLFQHSTIIYHGAVDV